MILIIDALNRDRYQDVLDDMFRLRARVFAGRLGWDVMVENDMEIDAFDALDPIYLVGLNPEGQVVSCVRLLQTMGPHMLSDVFHAILQGEPPLRAATMWESTRFCVDTERLGEDDRGMSGVARATSALMAATLSYARECGITDIITVIDPVMNRVLKRSDNAPYDYVGATVQMGKTRAMAALLDCSLERIARVRAFAGLDNDDLLDEPRLRAIRPLATTPLTDTTPPLWMVQEMLATPLQASKLSRAQIAQYCLEQVMQADDGRGLDAALDLAEAVLPDHTPPVVPMPARDRAQKRAQIKA